MNNPISSITGAFQMPMFEAFVEGYLFSASGFLNQVEIGYLAFSGKVITLEIEMRFLTDYLEGDTISKRGIPDTISTGAEPSWH